MKILYITNQTCGPGGLERVLSIKASYLADHYDYDVHMVTLNQSDTDLFYEFSPKIKYHNIMVSGNPISYFIKYAKGLRRIVKELNPDVIAVCDDGVKGLFVPIVIGKPCPMIYERHVSKNIEIKTEKPSLRSRVFTKIKFRFMDFGASLYNHFIVLTHGNEKEWNLKNMKVIPNPLSFYPDDQSTLQNKKVIVVGKQSYQKGYDRLLNSWKLVHEQHPDWHIDIYGTINKKSGLNEQLDSLGISASVHFYPPVKNIGEKYREASIYVMSSRYEGFGMVLTEAMAYGVPCVSFDCPHGPSDIISDKENGLLVENGDIKGLAEGMISLIENETSRKMMGQNAREAVKRYLPEKIAANWDDLFTGLIHNPSK